MISGLIFTELFKKELTDNGSISLGNGGNGFSVVTSVFGNPGVTGNGLLPLRGLFSFSLSSLLLITEVVVVLVVAIGVVVVTVLLTFFVVLVLFDFVVDS